MVKYLGFIFRDPFIVKNFIDVFYRLPRHQVWIGCHPQLFEFSEILPAAFAAWPVPCRKSGDFVQKEKFGPAVGRHDWPMPFFKFQEAGDPGFELPGAHDFPFRGVKPAPVAHQGSPG